MRICVLVRKPEFKNRLCKRITKLLNGSRRMNTSSYDSW